MFQAQISNYQNLNLSLEKYLYNFFSTNNFVINFEEQKIKTILKSKLENDKNIILQKNKRRYIFLNKFSNKTFLNKKLKKMNSYLKENGIISLYLKLSHKNNLLTKNSNISSSIGSKSHLFDFKNLNFKDINLLEHSIVTIQSGKKKSI